MSWTDEKVAKLKELWGKGNTASQIAEIIGGLSRNAVIGKAHRLNLSAKIKKRSTSINNHSKLQNIDNKITRRSRKSKFRSFILDKDFEPAKLLTLEQLTEETCKYMIHEDSNKEGHPDVPGSYFCGRKNVEKYSYCILHMHSVWQPRNKKEDVLDKDDDVPKFIEKKIKSA